MHARIHALVLGSLLLAAAPLTAQTRTINLTGRPTATISEPVSGASEGAELAIGKFVFVDRVEVAIRVADFGTGALTVLSRTGSGPGEYKRPTKAIADGKGGAVVADEALLRAVLVSGAGEVVGTGFDLQSFGAIPISIRGFDSQGRAYRWGRAGAAGRDSLPIERWDPATKTATVLAWWPQLAVIVGPVKKGRDGRMSAELELPSMFPVETQWVSLRDGSVAIVYQSPYRVDVVPPAGKRIRGPLVKYQPIKVTAAFRSWWSRTEFPAADDKFPTVLPPMDVLRGDGLMASVDGEIWAPRFLDWNDSLPKYDIFDKTGTLTARAVLKPHSKVVGFGRGVIYVARQSQEDDFWHLEKYRDRP